ncbi:MAG: 23S rRNA (adenine(2503)-C(2))-methyltransferase RlmN [Bacteroidota bacterium]
MSKEDIRKKTKDELKDFFLAQGKKAFRAKQVYEWLWQKGVGSFDDMTNLSKEDRKVLEENFDLLPILLKDEQKSKDGTIKCAFELYDGHLVESVLIPSAKRVTACISTQVGCQLGCSFCATAKIPFKRNLEVGEIFDQVVYLNQLAEKSYQMHLSNIVYMGMGEPLNNYENLIDSANIISAEEGLNFSPRRITVSTVGIPDKIKRLVKDNARFNLGVSLHTAINAKRDQIIPINKKYNLDQLKEALVYYHKETGNRIIFEYLMLGGFNDDQSDARALADYCRNFPVKVNLIEYNPIGKDAFKKSTEQKTEEFKAFLEKRNMIVTIRRSRGVDIDGACGQLAGKR